MKNLEVLIDTNILLDVFLRREEFFESSSLVFDMCCGDLIKGKIAGYSILNMFYTLRKNYSEMLSRSILSSLFQFFEIIPVDKTNLLLALKKSTSRDIEDCIQEECAYSVNADFIITRNKKDSENSKIRLVTPEEFFETEEVKQLLNLTT